MSIREKEERLQKAARDWELAAEAWEQAAEARTNAARAWEEAEKVHPIGFLNAIGQQAAREQQERHERLTRNPGEPRIGDN